MSKKLTDLKEFNGYISISYRNWLMQLNQDRKGIRQVSQEKREFRAAVLEIRLDFNVQHG